MNQLDASSLVLLELGIWAFLKRLDIIRTRFTENRRCYDIEVSVYDLRMCMKGLTFHI